MSRQFCVLVAMIASFILLGTSCGESGEGPPNSVEEQGLAGGKVVASVPSDFLVGLGEEVGNFSFRDVDGQRGTLKGSLGPGATVIAMRDSICPISLKFGPTTTDLEAKFADRGVQWLFLNCSQSDTTEKAQQDRRAFELKGPYIFDPSGRIGRPLAVRSTAEVLVLDAQGVMRYRGAIDDRFGIGVQLAEARNHYLIDALDAVLAEQKPKVEATVAPGCFLDLEAGATVAGAPTYHEDIEPLVQRYCQNCHSPVDISAFPFMKYDDFAGRKGMIRHVLETRYMPPWYAADGVGGPWENDLRIPEEKRKLILDWIDAGCPKGDPAKAPKARDFSGVWRMGTPDVVVPVSKPVDVAPEGSRDYFYRIVETSFPEDRYIQSMELKSDHMDAIHHILVFEYTKDMESWGQGQLDALALGGYFAVWGPGTGPLVYSEDRGRLLKKGTRLVFQLHYNGNGKQISDIPKIAFRFAKKKPRRLIQVAASLNKGFSIPPHSKQTDVRGKVVMPVDGEILGVVVHMHYRGRGAKMDLFPADGSPLVPLLLLPVFDFNWQLAYRFEKPIPFKAGARIDTWGRFDNSKDNPNNPDPSQHVNFGLKSSDEMLIGYVEWVPTN